MTVVCARCNGKGYIFKPKFGKMGRCNTCHGIGRKRALRRIKLPQTKYKVEKFKDLFTYYFRLKRYIHMEGFKRAKRNYRLRHIEKVREYDKTYKRSWRNTDSYREKNRIYMQSYRAKQKSVDKEDQV